MLNKYYKRATSTWLFHFLLFKITSHNKEITIVSLQASKREISSAVNSRKVAERG